MIEELERVDCYGEPLASVMKKVNECVRALNKMELCTTHNTGSPKLFTTCTECPLRWICSHDVVMKSPTCIDARKQLRAGA